MKWGINNRNSIMNGVMACGSECSREISAVPDAAKLHVAGQDNEEYLHPLSTQENESEQQQQRKQ